MDNPLIWPSLFTQMPRCIPLVEIRFFLKTNHIHFTNWLEWYTRYIPYKDYQVEDSFIKLNQACQSLRSDNTLVWSLRVDLLFPIEPQGTYDLETGIGSIDFIIISLTNIKTETVARCDIPIVLPYFYKLMLEICRRWPEAMPALEEHVQSFQPQIAANIELLQAQSDTPQEQPEPPLPKGRGRPNDDTIPKVAKALFIQKLSSATQRQSCAAAQVSRNTFRKWQHHPEVLEELENLRHNHKLTQDILEQFCRNLEQNSESLDQN
ncbi:MAG: hypothetical protein JXR84_05860 [Anaerolineae bacterium]|nr:hypothetical protein [Anaerolineae bacterium]